MSDYDLDDRGEMERRHADDSGSLADRETVWANIQGDFASLAIVFQDEGDLPATATGRFSAGSFDDPIALHEYLQDGGLVSYDENGDPVPVGWVYIVERETDDGFEYDVFVDSDTNGE